MWKTRYNNRLKYHKSQIGMALIELIVAVGLLSMVYLALQHSLLYFYQQSLKISQKIILQQTVFFIGRRISKEIKRANFLIKNSKEISISPSYFSDGCLIIAYDFNRNGKITNSYTDMVPERIAYRWHQQRLEYGISNQACHSKYWQSLMDYQQVVVSYFNVLVYSKKLLKLELRANFIKHKEIQVDYLEWITVNNGEW